MYMIDHLVWSKLESGRLPSLVEFKSLLEQDHVSFSTTDTLAEASS